MARPPIGVKRSALAILVAVMALVIGGCSGSGDDSADKADDATSSSDDSTPTTLDPEQTAVLEDYEAYWTTLLAASDLPAPDSPELAKHATGEELDRARDAVIARKEAGESLRGSYHHDASEITINDDEAELTDCLAPEIAVHDTTTGDLKTRYPSEAQSLVVSLERESNTWKVALISPSPEPCGSDDETSSTTATTATSDG